MYGMKIYPITAIVELTDSLYFCIIKITKPQKNYSYGKDCKKPH